MATANKDVDTARVVFNLVDIHFDTIMRSKNFSRNLVLFWQLGFNATKVDIDKAVVKAFYSTRHDFLFMLFVSVISNGTCLLAHFFHDGLFGRLSCYTTKLSRCFFKLDFVTKFIGWINGKSIFQADFQTAIKYFINNFTDSINCKVTCFFVKVNSYAVWLTIASAISGTKRLYYCVDDVFFFDSLVFFQNAEGL